MYSQKLLTGENIRQFPALISEVFYPRICVNDCIEHGDILAKILLYLQYKATWAWKNFCPAKVLAVWYKACMLYDYFQPPE